MKIRPATAAAFNDRLGLTVEEAATVMGIGRSKTYEFIRTGQLPARKVGSRTVILHEDAVELLRSLPTVAPKAA